MKKHITIFLLLGLGIVSGTMLVDRFFVSVPDWLAIILSIIAVILIIYHLTIVRKNKE